MNAYEKMLAGIADAIYPFADPDASSCLIWLQVMLILIYVLELWSCALHIENT